jgi:hypothetical protein
LADLFGAGRLADKALLLSFGNEDNFTQRQTFYIISFIRRHCITLIMGVEELTPKVRSLHVRIKANATFF